MVKQSNALRVLAKIPTEDLVDELKHRIAEADEAKVALATFAENCTLPTPAKNPRVAAAKEAYWRRRREWFAANPGKTVEDFHRESRRVLTFDSSVHNRLVKIGESANPIYAGIKSRYFFRLAGLSFEEMMSTPQAADRLALLDGCRKLTRGRWWDCLNPPYELLRILVVAHASDPSNFRWLEVDVRSGGLAYEIRNGELTADDTLANLQRTEQNVAIKAYKSFWIQLRSRLDPIFEEQGIPRPETFAEAFENASSTLLPAMGKEFYDAGLRFDAVLREKRIEPDTDMDAVRHFIATCPPFRALLCAVLMSWYNTSLRKGNTSEKFGAGRNDMFMAVYLPLCDIFVMRDTGQESCLKELTKYIGVRTEVLSFDDFTDSL